MVTAYGSFASGAIQQPDEARLQVLLALLGLVGVGLWYSGRLVANSLRAGFLGLGLLTAFAVWTGLSLIWSVAPDATWAELNRWIAYALAATLALACGASVTRAAERLAVAWLVAASAVILYALATKLVPGVHVGSVIDFNQEAVFSRLRAPLGYWNALALVCVLTVPFALALATDRARRARWRVTAEAMLALAILVGGMTFSRGGVLSVVVAVVAITLLGGAGLRKLAAVGLAAIAAAPGLAFAFASHTLTTDGASLASRERSGAILAAIVLASLGGLVGVGRAALMLETRVRWSATRSRVAWRAVAGAGGAGLIILIVVLSVSSRGLTGTISHQVDSFGRAHRDPITDPRRLLSTNSGNRWVWWKEAVGSWWDRPLGGWGAGSFPVVHLLYRKPPALPVRQPHSVPLQLLSETGLVGALLAVGGLLALLAAALARVRMLPRGRQRELTAALIAASIAWLVHGLFDWDTDIPAVTLPALLFLGVAAARPLDAARRGGRLGLAGGAAGARATVLGVASLLICAVAVSAILPAWAHGKAQASLVTAADALTPRQLQHAAQQAELAARLDPLSDEGPLDAATIAQRRGRVPEELRYLLQAEQREPYDVQAWSRLWFFALVAQDNAGANRAAQRALALDPLNVQLARIATATSALTAPPQGSAAATRTPLGAAAVAVDRLHLNAAAARP